MAKRKQITTPKAVFKFCHLNRPDHKGAERFGGEPMYRVTVVIEKDAKGFDAWMQEMNKLHQAALEAARETFDEMDPKKKAQFKKKGITEPTLNDWYEEELDDEGNPTGRIEVKFKTHWKFKDKQTGKVTTKTVPFYDAKGQLIPSKKRPFIYSGTEGRVAYATSNVYIPKDADAYLGMYLNQVQITALAEAGGGSAFEADDESDFSADDLEEYEGNAASDDDDDESGDLDGSDEDEEGSDDDGSLDDDIPFD